MSGAFMICPSIRGYAALSLRVGINVGADSSGAPAPAHSAVPSERCSRPRCPRTAGRGVRPVARDTVRPRTRRGDHDRRPSVADECDPGGVSVPSGAPLTSTAAEPCGRRSRSTTSPSPVGGRSGPARAAPRAPPRRSAGANARGRSRGRGRSLGLNGSGPGTERWRSHDPADERRGRDDRDDDRRRADARRSGVVDVPALVDPSDRAAACGELPVAVERGDGATALDATVGTARHRHTPVPGGSRPRAPRRPGPPRPSTTGAPRHRRGARRPTGTAVARSGQPRSRATCDSEERGERVRCVAAPVRGAVRVTGSTGVDGDPVASDPSRTAPRRRSSSGDARPAGRRLQPSRPGAPGATDAPEGRRRTPVRRAVPSRTPVGGPSRPIGRRASARADRPKRSARLNAAGPAEQSVTLVAV